MSTEYTLRAGPTVGRVDASGIHGLDVYEIRDSLIHVETYDEATTLVSNYSHIEWESGDPGPPADDDDADDESEGTVDQDQDQDQHQDDNDASVDISVVESAEEDVDDSGDDDEDDSAAVEAADDGDSSGDDGVDLDELSYRDLQGLAKEHDIDARQSADDLRDALHDAGVGE